jgi:putative endonuclease
LVWHLECQRVTDAIAAERQIKGWSRAKKEALINGDWNLVSELARNYTDRPRVARSRSNVG